MKTDTTEVKRIILKKLVSSGINITPPLLNFILGLENPIQKTNLIIKDTSFIAGFKSHLTEDILTQVSNEEIKNSLRRRLIKEGTNISRESSGIQPKGKQIEKALVNQETKSNAVLTSVETAETVPKRISDIEDNSQSPAPIRSTQKPIRTKLDPQPKGKVIEGSISTLSFKPKAKDYDFQYKILKDPTGKLYTSGDYQDFYDLTLDKYNRLKTLMRKRTEVHNADNINNILRLSSKVEVSVIALVSEIRKTKNENMLITLEDLTGLISVLIRKDSENQNNIKIAERTLNDQMVYIEGTYSPGEKGRPGIIYGNYITKIDIPKDYNPNKSYDPLTIALISDTHIGSKEFEEKLWNRFMGFLNGKIGNRTQREHAGKIKYLVINGDLVDGIGVYPTQQEDLKITDIYQQYNKAAELLSSIPDYIRVIYSSGNHEPVRIALPRPAVPEKYSEELRNNGVSCIGNPSLIQTHNVTTLIFHGDSILDLNMLIPGLDHKKSVETMKEILKCRHLAPTYGKRTQIAPINKDWLIIDKIPDIFHTGHIHINDMGAYNNISLVNSGCFQSQTDFMRSLGIKPTPGILSLVDLDTLKGMQLDLKNSL
ncbi:MAG: DNA-directed DNA polymerase II small subunit [Promethearchaeota archaeon]|jgi:DNA polymerase II small subunit